MQKVEWTDNILFESHLAVILMTYKRNPMGLEPFVITVCGGSCSGKSSFVQSIMKDLENNCATLVYQDNYYNDLSHLDPADRQSINFDHPSAIDSDLLVEHLSLLCEGQSILQPKYDFTSHTRQKKLKKVKANPLIILDGIFTLHFKKIVELSHLKIFLETDDDIRLIRRIKRDQNERGRSLEDVMEQYVSSVRPMHHAFVLPSKKNADIIIPTEENFERGLSVVVSYIKNHLSLKNI